MSETTTTGPSSDLIRVHDGVTVPAPGRYVIDPAHSTVGFVARHLVVSKVRGEFTAFEGAIVIGEDPRASSVEVAIDAASVSTRESDRDAHLRSGDFLSVEEYPKLTFSSSGLTLSGPGHYEVDGTLTIRGVSRTVTLEVEFNGAVADPYGSARLGFSASTEIDREDFGLTWNMAIEAGGVVVGRRVRIELEVEAVRAD